MAPHTTSPVAQSATVGPGDLAGVVDLDHKVSLDSRRASLANRVDKVRHAAAAPWRVSKRLVDRVGDFDLPPHPSDGALDDDVAAKEAIVGDLVLRNNRERLGGAEVDVEELTAPAEARDIPCFAVGERLLRWAARGARPRVWPRAGSVEVDARRGHIFPHENASTECHQRLMAFAPSDVALTSW